jgi:hypothetical protein
VASARLPGANLSPESATHLIDVNVRGAIWPNLVGSQGEAYAAG